MRAQNGFHKGIVGAGFDRDLAIYLAVAFGATWLILAPLALEGAGLLAVPIPGALHVLGGVGPALAAGVASRRAGLASAWHARLRRVPASPGPWLAAVGTPAALLAVALLVMALPGMCGGGEGTVVAGRAEPLAWGVVVSVAYGVLEEAGWRGYLLPRLQARRSALVASLLLGAIHVLWHAPMFLYRYDSGIGSVLGFSTSLMAGTIVFTHLFNRSRGSVPVTVAFHVAWNVAIVAGSRASGVAAAVMSVGLMVLAVAVVVRYGPATLAREPAVRLEPARARIP